MGFDILCFPPIHPIGITARKGPNNTLVAGPDDPGSPWAIGSSDGGHTAINPELGTVDDFCRLLEEVRASGMEVALDYALQCSPDHPWVTEHPQWFHHRPDGTIACAENPPKVYQDSTLWISGRPTTTNGWPCGGRARRSWTTGSGWVTTPGGQPAHQPIAFWEWLIDAVHAEHPDVLFLAEAFTRPKVMARLAEAGFSQSYTYFTWRTEQHGPDGLWAYVDELAHGPVADYMRPNSGLTRPTSSPVRCATDRRLLFALRLVLAATMSPSYGVYSGYELYENVPASADNEEYLQLREVRDKAPGLRPSRRAGRAHDFPQPASAHRHPAFQRLRVDPLSPVLRIRWFLAYSKVSDDRGRCRVWW